MKRLLLLLIITFALAACVSAPPPSPTPPFTITLTSTETGTLIPPPTTTHTPVPPTATPLVLQGKIAFWSNEFGGIWSIKLYDLETKFLTQLTDTQDNFSSASWSPDGRYLAYETYDERQGEIYLVDILENTTINLTDNTAGDYYPAWSPDGGSIAFVSILNGRVDIFIMDMNNREIRNLTRHPANDGGPAWSPDGEKILFGSTREGGTNQLFVIDIDGSNLKQLTSNDSPYIDSYAWSTDGSKIAFTYAEDVLADLDLYIIDPDGNNLKKLTNEGEFMGDVGSLFSWSPDGSRIAFYMDLGNQNNEIFVVDIVSNETTRMTYHNGGDFQPVWSLDGSMIAFVSTRDTSEETGNSIYVINAIGEGEPILIINIDWIMGQIFWIP